MISTDRGETFQDLFVIPHNRAKTGAHAFRRQKTRRRVSPTIISPHSSQDHARRHLRSSFFPSRALLAIENWSVVLRSSGLCCYNSADRERARSIVVLITNEEAETRRRR
mmetsp:Transcript_5411/g.17050  ORF Transcript_5411/g.17050 Transcript_5411/m.17050 type:complete len:110 (-) Transcript_5411:2769-3098(-)